METVLTFIRTVQETAVSLVSEISPYAVFSIGHTVLCAAYCLLLYLLIHFLSERHDLERRSSFYSFGAMLFFGALFHSLSLWPETGNWGTARLTVQSLYAFFAVLSAVSLWKILPETLRIPSFKQLNDAFENLSEQIALRKQAQKSLIDNEELLENQKKEAERLSLHIKQIEEERRKQSETEEALRKNINDLEESLRLHASQLDGLQENLAQERLEASRREKERQEEIAFSAFLLEGMKSGALLAAKDGTILKEGGVLSRLLGRKNSGNILDYALPEDRALLAGRLSEADFPEDSFEIRLYHADGTVRFAEMTARPLPFSSGKISEGRVLNISDITVQHGLELQMSMLPGLIRELNEVGDIHSILEAVLRKICLITEWEYGEAWVPRADGKILECSPACFMDDSFENFRELSQDLRIPPDAGIAGRVWVSGEPEWAEEITPDSGHDLFRKNAAQLSGIRSAFSAPVQMRNETFAVMLFFSRRTMVKNPRLEAWIMALGSHIASVLERKKTEERLRKAESGAESLVQERMHQLIAANENLQKELKDRKLMEEALRKSQAKNLALINSIEGIVYEYDLRTARYTFVSEQAQKILGYSVDLWLSEPAFWMEHIHGGDREEAMRFRRRAEQTHADEQFEYRMITLNGKNVWLRDMATVVTEGGVPVKVRGVMVDITDRKRMEEALNHERNFASAVLDTAGALVMIISREGRIIRFNRACEQICLCDAREVLGKYFWEPFLPPEETEKIKNIFTRLMAGQFPIHYESHWIANDDSVRNIAWTSTVLYSPDGSPEHVVAAGLDITRRKEIERQLTEAVSELGESNKELDKYSKELKDANERLQKMDEIKSHFISAASHELKTPLTSLKGYVETILQGEAGPINEQQKEFLGYVKESTDRLHRLLNELLDISKIESGQVAMNMELVNIRNLLKEEIMIFKPQADEKRITFGLEIAEGVRSVFCDSDKMREVMDNLISNAIKYTPRKGKINIYVKKSGSKIHIEVEDNGIGIKPEDMERIFEPFQYIEKHGLETDEESTGLGLTLVKKIIEAHGGEILVKSEPSKGSNFTVVLPGIEEISEVQNKHWAMTHE